MSTMPLYEEASGPRRAPLRRLALGLEPYLYIAPSVILIATIMLVPLIIGLSYAFRDMLLINPFSGGFVGLEHFRVLWTDAAFWLSMRNTLVWTLASVVLLGFGPLLLSKRTRCPRWSVVANPLVFLALLQSRRVFLLRWERFSLAAPQASSYLRSLLSRRSRRGLLAAALRPSE